MFSQSIIMGSFDCGPAGPQNISIFFLNIPLHGLLLVQWGLKMTNLPPSLSLRFYMLYTHNRAEQHIWKRTLYKEWCHERQKEKVILQNRKWWSTAGTFEDRNHSFLLNTLSIEHADCSWSFLLHTTRHYIFYIFFGTTFCHVSSTYFFIQKIFYL